MQNYSLLKEVAKARKPVLLKRGMNSTIEEFLNCAEYILDGGNPDVILCERGIRTFETYTRNTLDISAVPVLKELTHLPVIVDPSHASGKVSLVTPLSFAQWPSDRMESLSRLILIRRKPYATGANLIAGAIRKDDTESPFALPVYVEYQMKPLYFAGNRGCSRVILDTAISQLSELCEEKKTVVVVDRKVLELHRSTLPPYRFIEIDSEERNKTLKTVEKLYRRFLEWELDRSSTVIGVGGV
jgi:hypothetical protein